MDTTLFQTQRARFLANLAERLNLSLAETVYLAKGVVFRDLRKATSSPLHLSERCENDWCDGDRELDGLYVVVMEDGRALSYPISREDAENLAKAEAPLVTSIVPAMFAPN